MHLEQGKNRFIVFSIAVAVVCFLISYAVHVEYFKAFGAVFALGGAALSLFEKSPPAQKIRSTMLFVFLGFILYLIGRQFWN